jgi:hypothetical protein
MTWFGFWQEFFLVWVVLTAIITSAPLALDRPRTTRLGSHPQVGWVLLWQRAHA